MHLCSLHRELRGSAGNTEFGLARRHSPAQQERPTTVRKINLERMQEERFWEKQQCDARAEHHVRAVEQGARVRLARLPKRLLDGRARLLVHVHARAAAVVHAEIGAGHAGRCAQLASLRLAPMQLAVHGDNRNARAALSAARPVKALVQAQEARFASAIVISRRVLLCRHASRGRNQTAQPRVQKRSGAARGFFARNALQWIRPVHSAVGQLSYARQHGLRADIRVVGGSTRGTQLLIRLEAAPHEPPAPLCGTLTKLGLFPILGAVLSACLVQLAQKHEQPPGEFDAADARRLA
eukprot:scaffold10191_cov108-Isochrysis_galbana.AAC.7